MTSYEQNNNPLNIFSHQAPSASSKFGILPCLMPDECTPQTEVFIYYLKHT